MFIFVQTVSGSDEHGNQTLEMLLFKPYDVIFNSIYFLSKGTNSLLLFMNKQIK